MLKFRSISINDKILVDGFLAQSNFMGSEYCFTNLFLWRKLYNTKIAESQGYLIIMIEIKGKKYYLFPPGEGELYNAIKSISIDAKRRGDRLRVISITNEGVNTLNDMFPDKFEFTSNSDWFDYVYESKALINLKGKKYNAKRNHINKFKANYSDYCYEDISDANINECIKAYEIWLKNKGGNKEEYIEESIAVYECFKYYRELDLSGGLIRADEKVCSFSFGSKINSETFGIHIEKAILDCEGGYAVINKEFATHHGSEYKYINREEDLGLEGLRKAKQSYYPVFLLEKHIAVLKANSL